MIGYWLICRRIAMGNISEEAIEAHLFRNALLRVTPSGEKHSLLQCWGILFLGSFEMFFGELFFPGKSILSNFGENLK